jgi:hypothetical protein
MHGLGAIPARGGGAFMFLIVLVFAGVAIYAFSREPGSQSPKQ